MIYSIRFPVFTREDTIVSNYSQFPPSAVLSAVRSAADSYRRSSCALSAPDSLHQLPLPTYPYYSLLQPPQDRLFCCIFHNIQTEIEPPCERSRIQERNISEMVNA